LVRPCRNLVQCLVKSGARMKRWGAKFWKYDHLFYSGCICLLIKTYRLLVGWQTVEMFSHDRIMHVYGQSRAKLDCPSDGSRTKVCDKQRNTSTKQTFGIGRTKRLVLAEPNVCLHHSIITMKHRLVGSLTFWYRGNCVKGGRMMFRMEACSS
jgi:hypothetical protein